MADEAARAAARMGMNAGPGSLFPIAPGPTSQLPGRNFAPSGDYAPNQFAPQAPTNWPGNAVNGAPVQAPPNAYAPNPNMNFPNGGNFNRQPAGPPQGEPPVGSFGPGGYDTSVNSEALPESPAQFALRDRLPQSEQYQTPSAFAVPNAVPVQAAGFQQNRGLPNQNQITQPSNTRDLIAEMERASSRSTPNRAGGDDRWEQGSAPNGLNPNTTVPTKQGFLAIPTGENALAEKITTEIFAGDERTASIEGMDA